MSRLVQIRASWRVTDCPAVLFIVSAWNDEPFEVIFLLDVAETVTVD